MTKPVVGFIGTGVMGKSMAGHILAAGYPLVVYNRTKEKANELLKNGAKWANSPKELVKQADIVFTIVGMPSDVEEVYLSENGLIEHSAATHLAHLTLDILPAMYFSTL